MPGYTLLFNCSEAPAPSGPTSARLKEAMLNTAASWFFGFRVSIWAFLTRRYHFDWARYRARLEGASFNSFADWRESMHSIGWAGYDPKTPDTWLFGVLGFWIPFVGGDVQGHELFHACQDEANGLFRKRGCLLGIAAEYSAHFWGGPLLGIPLAYGGTGIILYTILVHLVVPLAESVAAFA